MIFRQTASTSLSTDCQEYDHSRIFDKLNATPQLHRCWSLKDELSLQSKLSVMGTIWCSCAFVLFKFVFYLAVSLEPVLKPNQTKPNEDNPYPIRVFLLQEFNVPFLFLHKFSTFEFRSHPCLAGWSRRRTWPATFRFASATVPPRLESSCTRSSGQRSWAAAPASSPRKS